VQTGSRKQLQLVQCNFDLMQPAHAAMHTLEISLMPASMADLLCIDGVHLLLPTRAALPYGLSMHVHCRQLHV
jgi:hypothetical protein